MSAVHNHSGRHLRKAPLRISVVPGTEPEDWRRIYERLNKRSQWLMNFLLKLSAALGTFVGLFVTSAVLAVTIYSIEPAISPHYLASAVLLPGLLAGAAAGQMSGNLFLKIWNRLGTSTRRGFAMRLTLGRCPMSWSVFLKRWLFTGDWLGHPAFDLRLPYLRIYIKGEAPVSCREEEALWREIHAHVSGDEVWEAGANIREVSYPSELPVWAGDIANGEGFADLQRRIGRRAASEWVQHLWRRACRQWPSLGANDYPERARRECFEMHRLELSGNREALVVVLRPVNFVHELEEELAAEEKLAA